ncbi:MAG: alpha/beta fold hydrolase [Chloroflexota bacterium]
MPPTPTALPARARLAVPRAAMRRRIVGPDLPLADPAPAGRTLTLADGRVLGWDDTGDAAGTPVVWLHGFGSTRLIRHPDDAIAARLGVRLIAPDRPGVGLSSPQPGRRVVDHADEIVRIADTIGVGRFGILAWSGGGPYALACAHRHPDRVAHVGLVSAAAPLAGPQAGAYVTPFHRLAGGASAVAPWAVRAAMLRWARAQRRDPAAHLDAAIDGMVPADRDILAEPRFRAVMLRNAAELYRQGIRGLADEALLITRDWGFPLERIDVPVRIWHGELDPAVPAAMGRHLAARIPGAEATFLPEEGHQLFLARWEELLGAVAERTRGALGGRAG